MPRDDLARPTAAARPTTSLRSAKTSAAPSLKSTSIGRPVSGTRHAHAAASPRSRRSRRRRACVPVEQVVARRRALDRQRQRHVERLGARRRPSRRDTWRTCACRTAGDARSGAVTSRRRRVSVRPAAVGVERRRRRRSAAARAGASARSAGAERRRRPATRAARRRCRASRAALVEHAARPRRPSAPARRRRRRSRAADRRCRARPRRGDVAVGGNASRSTYGASVGRVDRRAARSVCASRGRRARCGSRRVRARASVAATCTANAATAARLVVDDDLEHRRAVAVARRAARCSAAPPGARRPPRADGASTASQSGIRRCSSGASRASSAASVATSRVDTRPATGNGSGAGRMRASVEPTGRVVDRQSRGGDGGDCAAAPPARRRERDAAASATTRRTHDAGDASSRWRRARADRRAAAERRAPRRICAQPRRETRQPEVVREPQRGGRRHARRIRIELPRVHGQTAGMPGAIRRLDRPQDPRAASSCAVPSPSRAASPARTDRRRAAALRESARRRRAARADSADSVDVADDLQRRHAGVEREAFVDAARRAPRAIGR